MNTKAVRAASPNKLPKEHHVIIDLLHADMIVLNPAKRRLHLDKLMIMSGEQNFRTKITMFVQIFCYSPSNAYPVVSACASSYLVKKDKAPV